MKNITIRPYILTWIVGRVVTTLVLGLAVLLIPFLSPLLFKPEEEILFKILMIVFFLFIGFEFVYLERILWPKFWGKIVLKSDRIVWRCLFCKSVEIPFENLKTVKLCEFKEGNAVYNLDPYGVGSWNIVISDKQFIGPIKRVDKIKCKNGTIKFMATKKLISELSVRLPEPYSQYLKNRMPSKLK